MDKNTNRDKNIDEIRCPNKHKIAEIAEKHIVIIKCHRCKHITKIDLRKT